MSNPDPISDVREALTAAKQAIENAASVARRAADAGRVPSTLCTVVLLGTIDWAKESIGQSLESLEPQQQTSMVIAGQSTQQAAT